MYIFGLGGGSRFESYPPPSSRLGSSFLFIIIIKHAYAGTNERFTHLRALFGTPSTAAFWPTLLSMSASSHYSY
jgi:hypothetical protein